MEFHFINPRKNALVYIIKILSGSLILWYGLRALGFPEPYWAMISLIIVTEPDMTGAKANFRARLINTISGCIIACLSLVLFGATFRHADRVDGSGTGCDAVAKLSQQLAPRPGHGRDPDVRSLC